MGWYFLFFFISGFCSVLYELIWLRLTMAQFGVTTAMVSIVLSVFMAGLGLGSWASGLWLRHPRSASTPALRMYAFLELLIGLSAILVPGLLLLGHRTLQDKGHTSSFAFYVLSGLWVAATLIPWCALMGATVPVGMRAIAQNQFAESARSFSYLYMANVAGAVAGTAIPLFLIELLGFRETLRVGAAANCLIAISALTLSNEQQNASSSKPIAPEPSATSTTRRANLLALLFLTGLTCMAMEVVWVRRYTPYLGTLVYAFASILAVYLLATFFGALFYRRWSSHHTAASPALWSLVAATALLPLIAASPIVHMGRAPRLVLGLALFTGLLGFITPMLVDRFSEGNPAQAGKAYAINIAGCILGPLLAGFGLLPYMSERTALVLLTIPWLLIGMAPLVSFRQLTPVARFALVGSLILSAILITFGRGYDENLAEGRLLRDSTATVIAKGTGMEKHLLVNGFGMTSLTPITKVMAHFPLASLDHPPQNGLVICFGMGTTFRAMRSWNIPVTVVELVPSVPKMFDYYHSDGEVVMQSPLAHVVVDDGRRYLERTSEQYDVITIDPPPPLAAAGSSLLYSKDFYQVARRRLRPGGILQQWLPSADEDVRVVSSIARSVRDSFPYVRTFWDEFGVHFLCSDQPIPQRSAQDLASALPPAAIADFVEWSPASTGGAKAQAVSQFDELLDGETNLDSMIAEAPNMPALSDDRPVNEYSLLRKWFGHKKKVVAP